MPGSLQPAKKQSKSKAVGITLNYGEAIMELRVQLKVCEGCGCLWYRTQNQGSVYCLGCEAKLKDFPTAESRKRPGRPCRKPLAKVWAVAETTGGVQ
jgi:hypothetical protein